MSILEIVKDTNLYCQKTTDESDQPKKSPEKINDFLTSFRTFFLLLFSTDLTAT